MTKRRAKVPGIAERVDPSPGSRTWVIVNENAGTVRSLGITAARDAIARGFAAGDPPARIEFVSGDAIAAMLDEALSSGTVDTIVVGGGDGTMSSVASKLAGTGKTMGVLPLGTMNLFARALGMPNSLEESVKALASARPVAVDVGRVNGRIFLHHVSLGLHPRMARIRERIGYGSRLTKIVNSVRAFLLTLRRPPRLKLDASLNGVDQRVRSPAVLVSNNLFGTGHVPYQDRLDDGLLGLYVVNTFRKRDIFGLAGSLLTATWQASPHVDIQTGKNLEIRALNSGWSRRRKILASIDGELEYVRAPLRIEILPISLIVLSAKG